MAHRFFSTTSRSCSLMGEIALAVWIWRLFANFTLPKYHKGVIKENWNWIPFTRKCPLHGCVKTNHKIQYFANSSPSIQSITIMLTKFSININFAPIHTRKYLVIFTLNPYFDQKPFEKWRFKKNRLDQKCYLYLWHK